MNTKAKFYIGGIYWHTRKVEQLRLYHRIPWTPPTKGTITTEEKEFTIDLRYMVFEIRGREDPTTGIYDLISIEPA